MVGGRLAGETAIGSLFADAALVPVLRRVHGPAGAQAGAAVLAPMIAKRLSGNAAAPRARRWRVYLTRLLLDRDELSKS
jgi:hypothetical protein